MFVMETQQDFAHTLDTALSYYAGLKRYELPNIEATPTLLKGWSLRSKQGLPWWRSG